MSILEHWEVRQHAKEIKAGDRAFIWEAGPDAGIVAVAIVKSDPAPMEDTPEEAKFYPNGPPLEFQGKRLRVRVEVVQEITPIIHRSLLVKDPILKDLKIIRNPRGTNFSITEEQVDKLDALLP